MTELKEFLLRRISHAEKRVNELKAKHGSNPNETHTYYGGWDLGYWQGMLAAYHNVLDELEETPTSKRNRYTLEELVSQITPENRHEEIDFGIEGNEII
jgi:hypothetical protein